MTKDSSHFDIEKIKRLYASVGKLITSAESVDAVLTKLMAEVENFFQPENWSLLRLDPTAKELFFLIVKGIASEQVENIRLKVGEGIAGSVAQSGASIFVSDANEDKRFSQKVDQATGFTTRSIMAVPVKFQNQVFGVIELINRVDGELFGDDELFILETIGDFAAIAFTNALRYENVVNLSRIDPLTGAYNRMKLDELIADWENAEYRRADDSTTFVCVSLIDVNEFKTVNDTQGHRAGDDLLRETAKALIDFARDGDYFFRIGGDEFLMITFHKNISNKEALVERLTKRLQALSDRSPNPAGFSFGVSCGHHAEVNALIHQSDLIMYEHKNKVKNKSCS